MILFNDEQTMLKEMVQDFADREVAPLADEIDQDERFPKETFQKMAELGLLGVRIPEEYGGSGKGVTETCIIAEELARVCASTAASWGAHVDLCTANLTRNANRDQSQRYLPALAKGSKIGALAMTESSAGSDIINMKMTAVRKGDHYILNGNKLFITNGPVADVLIVYAKTEPEREARGISAFIVENTFPGYSVGRPFEKLGWRGSPTSEIIFEDCKAPVENLLGEENRGFQILLGGLNTERIVMAAESLGLARGAMKVSLNYSKERYQFGKPIAQFQMIQQKFARMAMEIEAARLMVYQYAALADSGNVQSITLEAAAAKLFCSEMVMRTTIEAVQILGGYGYVNEFPVERYMRDAKLFSIGGGTSEIMCHIIARELMKQE